LIDIEETVQSLSGLNLKGKLVVQMSVLISHPKTVLLREFGTRLDIDIVTSHAMFGALSPLNVGEVDGFVRNSNPLDGRPIIYEKVRVSDIPRFERFLKIFEEERCQLVEMNSEQHDATIADAEFVTYLTGRLLADKQLLPPTPIVSKEYAALSEVADSTAGDNFDLFFGMFKYNDRAKEHLSKLRENLARIERQLAAKEAYISASMEMKNSDRQILLAETRKLLEEVVASSSGKFASPIERLPIGKVDEGNNTKDLPATKKIPSKQSRDDTKR
jgi:arogenate dehydrogenase (NADP+), plant